MEELKRLVRIVTLFSHKKISLFDFNNLNEASKEERLVKNIIENKYKSDKEAVEDIYQSNKNSYRYRMLKSRVRQKLYNHLFFVNPSTSISKEEEKACLNMTFQGKVILQTADHKLAETLFKKALTISEKYEFTDITIDCLLNLNLIYAHLPNFKLYTKTLKKLKEYRKLKVLEEEAQELYYTTKLILNKSIASKKESIIKLPQIISQLKELWEKTGSFNIFQYYYYLNSWHLELEGNYIERIADIEKNEQLLKENQINSLRFDSRLNKYTHIYSLLRAHQYNKGLLLAEEYIKVFNPYSRNWFAFMEYYFLLAMHSERYQLATDLIFKVDSNPYAKRLKVKATEKWQLYKGYLYFIYSKASFVQKFNFQKFITTVPEHGKDKLGYNVSIHILQFLYYLKNKDYDQLYYKENALRKYLNTYLKDANSQRSKYFFRLLILAIRSEFNPVKAEKKATKLLEKLKATSAPGDAYAETEIIPYEELWELILGLMRPDN